MKVFLILFFTFTSILCVAQLSINTSNDFNKEFKIKDGTTGVSSYPHDRDWLKYRFYPTSVLLNLDYDRNVTLDDLKSDLGLLSDFHLRYCLRQYHKVRQTALYFGISGAVVASAGGYFYDKSIGKAALYTGGGLCLTSLILYISAEKWLKYSSIKPKIIGKQVALTYTF